MVEFHTGKLLARVVYIRMGKWPAYTLYHTVAGISTIYKHRTPRDGSALNSMDVPEVRSPHAHPTHMKKHNQT